MESYRGEAVQKSDDFVVNLGGRRPPGRIRAYRSSNKDELNNTRIASHRHMYLLGLCGQ